MRYCNWKAVCESKKQCYVWKQNSNVVCRKRKAVLCAEARKQCCVWNQERNAMRESRKSMSCEEAEAKEHCSSGWLTMELLRSLIKRAHAAH
eukprot:1014975-Pelagomonas_calceolata.AAC.2